MIRVVLDTKVLVSCLLGIPSTAYRLWQKGYNFSPSPHLHFPF